MEPLIPRIAVAAVICRIGKNGAVEVLFFKRKRHPQLGFYHVPGGKLEFGETLLHGLLREVKEEVGVDVYPMSETPDFIQEYFNFEHSAHFITHYFICNFTGIPEIKEPSKHEDLRWIEWNNIKEKDNACYHIRDKFNVIEFEKFIQEDLTLD